MRSAGLRGLMFGASVLLGLAMAAPASRAAEPCGVAVCGNRCGEHVDGCGEPLDCGPCLPPMCGNGICQGPRGETFETCLVDCPTDCIPRTCENRCGWIPTGCGGLMECGGCSSSCVPHGCTPGESGPADDGCGNTIYCGASSGSCGNHDCDPGENCVNCPGDCSASLDFNIQVEAGQGLCQIGGGGFDESIYVGTTVRFTAVASTLNQFAPIWDFGDGSMESIGLSASHTYTAPGPAEVRLFGYDAHCGVGQARFKRLRVCSTIQYDLGTARQLMEQRRWAEAETILRTIPGATAPKMLAKCLSRQGRFGAALPLGSDGVNDCGGGAFSAECEDALYGLGEALIGLHRFNEDISRMSSVISNSPADPGRKWAYYWRGMGYYKQHKADPMVADFEDFLKFDCSSPEAMAVAQLLSALRAAVPETLGAACSPYATAQCGDDVCWASESASTCYTDCHCGDNVCQTYGQCLSACNGSQNNGNCIEWCWARGHENGTSCPVDCGRVADFTVWDYFSQGDAPTEAGWNYEAPVARGMDAFAGLSLSFPPTNEGLFGLATQSAGPTPPIPPPTAAQAGTPGRQYSTAAWRQADGGLPPLPPLACVSYADVSFPTGSGSPSLFEWWREQEWVDVTTERKEPKAVCGQPEEYGTLAIFATHNRRPSVTVSSVECHPTPSTPCSVTVVADGRDPDGDTLAYEWTGCSGTGSSATCTVPGLVDLPFSVRVRDGKGGVARASGTARGVNRAAVIAWFGFSEPEPLARNQDVELYFTIDDDDAAMSDSCHAYTTGQCTKQAVDCVGGAVAFRTKNAPGLCHVMLRWTDRWGVVTPPDVPETMSIMVQ